MSDSSKQHQGSNVVQFYKGKNLLVTGASGFLGKVILWKLIESCPDTGTIYLLLRSKHNQSAQKRLLQIVKSKPFYPKYQAEELLKKVVAIDSDLTSEGLGLGEEDRSLLEKEVNVVIHSAASIKFDAPLKDNLRDNVTSTRSVLDLCKSIQNLQTLVHVSTAYSNCHLKEINEEIIPLEKDIDAAVKMINDLPEDACEQVTENLLEGRPNTYTYTKAIAEHFVAREEGKFPIAIVRPSIVIPANNEPSPGWVDNVNGICGLGCLGAIGVLRTIDWDYYSTSDMVPVDYVANCILCSAYQVSKESPKKIRVYNMTSGRSNPISWGKFFQLLRENAVSTPTNRIIRPVIDIPTHRRANPVTFFIIRYFSELLFAYVVDFILTMIGYKKVLVKITQRMHNGYKILLPFTTNEWDFKSENLNMLGDSLNPVDKELFKFDMRGFDWKVQADHTWAGGRTHILKDENTEDSYKSAKKRQFYVGVIHYGFIALAMLLVFYSSIRLLQAYKN